MSRPDLEAAKAFMAGHARLLERRRLLRLLGEGEAADVLAALAGYRNPDGGYGWGLEPDLRSAGSQPVGAMHALEVFAECAPVTSAHAVELCDWLQVQSLGDGGLPFALAVADPAGSSPIWTRADPAVSSLQMTTQVAAHAHRLAPHQPEVDGHPWLAAATRYCLEAIGRIGPEPHAYELMFSLRFWTPRRPVCPRPTPRSRGCAGTSPRTGSCRSPAGRGTRRCARWTSARRPACRPGGSSPTG